MTGDSMDTDIAMKFGMHLVLALEVKKMLLKTPIEKASFTRFLQRSSSDIMT
jgi:hypothetical protein